MKLCGPYLGPLGPGAFDKHIHFGESTCSAGVPSSFRGALCSEVSRENALRDSFQEKKVEGGGERGKGGIGF